MDKQTQALGPTVWVLSVYRPPEGARIMGIYATADAALKRSSAAMAYRGGKWSTLPPLCDDDGLGFRSWVHWF